MDSTRPTAPDSAAADGLDPAAVRKVARADRRAELFAVVREAMQRCGFPADAYSFKVVALDADGWRFLVLVDLAATLAASEAQPEPESVQALVALAAKTRAGVVVEGVYWRPTAAAPGDGDAQAAESPPPKAAVDEQG